MHDGEGRPIPHAVVVVGGSGMDPERNGWRSGSGLALTDALGIARVHVGPYSPPIRRIVAVIPGALASEHVAAEGRVQYELELDSLAGRIERPR